VPARVDRATGYRRYTEDQIATAGRIALLRRAGIGLADIERFLAAPTAAVMVIDHTDQRRFAELKAAYPGERELLLVAEESGRPQAPPWASCPPGRR
jgi:DNA-binding transcriptional MerR regulator